MLFLIFNLEFDNTLLSSQCLCILGSLCKQCPVYFPRLLSPPYLASSCSSLGSQQRDLPLPLYKIIPNSTPLPPIIASSSSFAPDFVYYLALSPHTSLQHTHTHRLQDGRNLSVLFLTITPKSGI